MENSNIDNRFLKTTKDKTLRLLQELETGALVELDRICRKHNIEYSLGGGTCLGQVRHGGFIPWDDDIDVDMTIDNYEKFMKVAPGELEGTEYYLLSRETDPNYMRSYSRIVVKDTIMNNRSNARLGQGRGLFIDIFCWNYLPNNKFLRKVVSSTLFYVRCAIKFQDLGRFETAAPPKMRRIVYLLGTYISFERLKKIEYKLNHLYKKPTKWFMEDVTVKGNFGGYPVEGMNDFKDVVFEGKRVVSKVNTDTFLTILYGSKYNEWLPPAKRLSVHTWHEVDFGHYAEEAGLPADYRECFTNAYTEEKLVRMKQLSYDMIERCADICSRHGLKYYVVGHDMLFKALDAEEMARMWTHPMKIAMPLKDYDVFRSVCREELGGRFYFQDYEGNSSYEPPFGRVGMNYTHIREVFIPSMLERQTNTGFFIKIIPLAFTANDKEERKMHRKRLDQLKKYIYLHWYKYYKMSTSNKETVKRFILSFTSTKRLHNKYDRVLRKYSDTDWLIDGSSGQIHRITVPKDYFGEGTVCDWDGRKLVFPDKPEAIYDMCFTKLYVKTVEDGKMVIRRFSGEGELKDVFTAELNQEELEFIRKRFDNCLLNYYDLPECQLTVLRYDEKEDRLLSDEEIMGPDWR